MGSLMRDQIRQFKILQAIVHLVMVAMMYVFVRAQLTTQMLFHHVAMVQDAFAVHGDAPVTVARFATLAGRVSEHRPWVAVLSPASPMFGAVPESVSGPSAIVDGAEMTNARLFVTSVTFPPKIMRIAHAADKLAIRPVAAFDLAFHFTNRSDSQRPMQ